MDAIPLWVLILALLVCLMMSAFFSSSETSMMSINRYRLKHQVEAGKPAARRVAHLLKRPDRLLGSILLGNNFVNIAATSLGTIIGIRLYGDFGVVIATVVLTVIVLIFAEVMPKTLAAIYSERLALAVSWPLQWIVRIFYPVVGVINLFVSALLRPFGLRTGESGDDAITDEELKTLVQSSAVHSIAPERQDMLMGVLELEDVSVDEAMIPRKEIEGVDFADDWEDILKQILNSRHGRLVAYRDHIDKVIGMLHLRDVIGLFHENRLSKSALQKVLRPCVFVPEGTPLRQQLLQFQAQRVRSGLVVDEYGDIQGLITLEDILTHIVGDVVSEHDEDEPPEIVQRGENLYDVEGTISLRSLNRELGLKLPLDGPNTLNGLIIETLGNFPEAGTEVALPGCMVRVLSFDSGVIGHAEVQVIAEEDNS